MKLSKILPLLAKEYSLEKLSPVNIDDYLLNASKLGITELEVNHEEMAIAVTFYLFNAGDMDKNKGQVLKEGKVNRLLGIKLKYETIPTSD